VHFDPALGREVLARVQDVAKGMAAAEAPHLQ